MALHFQFALTSERYWFTLSRRGGLCPYFTRPDITLMYFWFIRIFLHIGTSLVVHTGLNGVLVWFGVLSKVCWLKRPCFFAWHLVYTGNYVPLNWAKLQWGYSCWQFLNWPRTNHAMFQYTITSQTLEMSQYFHKPYFKLKIWPKKNALDTKT